MPETRKRRKKRAPMAEVDKAKVERLRQQLERGQLGLDFSKLVDGLAHAMQDKHNTPY